VPRPARATAPSATASRQSSSRQQVESDATDPNKLGLIGEHRDRGDRGGAVGNRDGHVDQYPPRIVPRPALA
jgi:hypothetical protein